MKKISNFALVLVLLLGICITGLAADEVKVYLNGEQLEFDVPPQVIQDRTMVPMRVIFETLGAKVEWVEADQLIIATFQTKLMTLKINEKNITIADIATGDNQTIALDVPPQVVNDRTLVPLRAIAESFSATVNWDEATSSVFITTE